MNTVPSFEDYGGNAAQNYERYFVPPIGAPLAARLVDLASPASGERVLDLACGTGIAARLAAERVGKTGRVHGVDANPAMLSVARAITASDSRLTWQEAGAEDIPVPDASYHVTLCQMGLQFFPDRDGSLHEVYRLLVPGGRIALNLPGPTPELFQILAKALARHVSPEAAGFLLRVFSLHDISELTELMARARFEEVVVSEFRTELRLPRAPEFLWQYVHSTPLAGALQTAGAKARKAIEEEVVADWQPFEGADGMRLELRMLEATGRRPH